MPLLEHVNMDLNGERRELDVEPRWTLADVLRESLGATATHVGCEHGICGACTVLVDGLPARSCLMLAVQADGSAVTTAEGLSTDGAPHPLQLALSHARGLQCGFCTPGFLMVAEGLLAEVASPSREEIEDALASNLCRCTGYEGIVAAVASVSRDRDAGQNQDCHPEEQRWSSPT